jgi:hypothetical protein
LCAGTGAERNCNGEHAEFQTPIHRLLLELWSQAAILADTA